MKKTGGASLRNRFLVLFVLIFVGGSVVSYAVMSWFTRDLVGTLGGWFAEKSVLYEKARVLQLLVREITLTQKMASSPLLKAWVRDEADPRARERALAELKDFRDFFRSKSYFFAIARSGHYYFDDGNGNADPRLPRYTLSESVPKDGWFYATLRQVPDYELNVDTDRHLKLTKVWINTVLKDESEALAVIGTGVDLSDFIRSVISTPQPGVTNLLLDRNGAIQAHQDVSIIDFASIAKEQRNERQSTLFNLIDDQGGREAFQDALKDLAAGKADTRTLQVTIQGKRHIAGIAYLPDIKWYMVSLTHPESAENFTYLVAVFAIRIGGLALMLLIVGILFDRLVLRRLAVLDAAAKQVSAGNYAIRLPQQGRDELSRLGQTFQEMTDRIAAHTTDLERQVAERTKVLERQAQADFLTGLLNRRGMGDRILGEKNRLAREGGKLGMLILDLDHFKKINDNHGHDLGDRALVHTASTIRGVMRSYDLCARWGGEEFLVIVPHIVNREALAIVAEKLRAAIKASPIDLGGVRISLTVSIGGYFADPRESTDAILKAADDALYQAKQGGRDRAVITELASQPAR
ncbi:MAG TPA: diguanylate cyclase [Burkholderiales bacterium]|nr:diguanylate cyclase [Burkholderiales bacterium]